MNRPFSNSGYQVIQRAPEVPRADEIGARARARPAPVKPTPAKPALTQVDRSAAPEVQKAQRAARKAETALIKHLDELARIEAEIAETQEQRENAKRASDRQAFKTLTGALNDLQLDLEFEQEQTADFEQAVESAHRRIFVVIQGPLAEASYRERLIADLDMRDRETAHKTEGTALARRNGRHTGQERTLAEDHLKHVLNQGAVDRIRAEVESERAAKAKRKGR